VSEYDSSLDTCESSERLNQASCRESQVLKVFGPGRTFADIAVFDDEPQPAEAVAGAQSPLFRGPTCSIS
jgi:hypothetical protein